MPEYFGSVLPAPTIPSARPPTDASRDLCTVTIAIQRPYRTQRKVKGALLTYNVEKHGNGLSTSISLMRKAIETQLVLLNEGQLRRLLMSLNEQIADGIAPPPTPPPSGPTPKGAMF